MRCARPLGTLRLMKDLGSSYGKWVRPLAILPDIKVRPTLCRTSSSTRKNTADGLPWLPPSRSIRAGAARLLRRSSKARPWTSCHQEGCRHHCCRLKLLANDKTTRVEASEARSRTVAERFDRSQEGRAVFERGGRRFGQPVSIGSAGCGRGAPNTGGGPTSRHAPADVVPDAFRDWQSHACEPKENHEGGRTQTRRGTGRHIAATQRPKQIGKREEKYNECNRHSIDPLRKAGITRGRSFGRTFVTCCAASSGSSSLQGHGSIFGSPSQTCYPRPGRA